MKKTGRAALAVLLAVFLLAGCAPRPSETEEAPSPTPYEGYLPENSEAYKLFGGMQLWYSGFGVRSAFSDMNVRESELVSKMTESLEKTEEFPFLRFAVPAGAEKEDLFLGADAAALHVDVEAFPVVKLSYRTNSADNRLHLSLETNSQTLQAAASADPAVVGDETWQEAVFDLRALLTEEDQTLYAPKDEVIKVLFRPLGREEVTSKELYFDIQYMAFFPDAGAAAAFDKGQEAHYLQNYSGADLVYEEVTDEILDTYLGASDKRVEEILNSPNMDLSEITGRCFYISNNGNDANDGLSPETPWATLEKLKEAYLSYGISYSDIILFERGSVWRGAIPIEASMRYSAYGEGPKPRFYQSHSGASPLMWEATDVENVWRYTGAEIETDIGNIVFNEGECWGIKLTLDTDTNLFVESGMVTNGVDVYRSAQREYTGPDCITGNLEFYYDIYDTHNFYLRCDWGNPGDCFDSIELSENLPHVSFGQDTAFVTLDNLAFMYTGGHAVSVFSAVGVTVQNCTFEWIGGSIEGLHVTTRYGNGFQNWGSCSSIVVKDCYLNQIYDSAITTQNEGGGVSIVDGFTVTGNVVDRANTAFEFFNVGNKKNYYKDVIVRDNYMRYQGFHFGHQRPSKGCGIFSGSKSIDCPFIDSVYENNVGIYFSKNVNSNRALVKDTFLFRNNVYIGSSERSKISRSSGNIADSTGDLYLYPYQERYIKAQVTAGVEQGSKFYYYTGYLYPEEAEGVYYGLTLKNQRN